MNNVFTLQFLFVDKPMHNLVYLVQFPSALGHWTHLFRVAGREKRRGEQLKWSVAFRLYIGSFQCAQLYQDQFIQPGWAECVFCVFSLGLYFVYSFVFF